MAGRGPAPGDYREHRVTTGSSTARKAERVMAGDRPPPTLAGWSVPAEPARLDGLQLSSCDTTSEGLPSCCGLPGAAGCLIEEGGKLEVGGFEDSLRRGWNSVLRVPSSGGLRPLDSKLLANRQAVRGFGRARASRLPDGIGRRSDTASQLVCSTLLLSMGISGRLP